MTALQSGAPAFTSGSSVTNGQSVSPAKEGTPWLFAFLCLIIPLLPAYSVPPGPLKSNGSPSRVIALALCGVMFLGFFLVRRTVKTKTLSPGVLIIIVYFCIMLGVTGIGMTRVGSALVEAGKTRAMIELFSYVGLALYATTRVTTFRQRSIVLGALAIGLTYNCAVGFLQNTAHIDLHLLLQPPGFVDNQQDVGGRGIAATATDRFGATRAFGTSAHAIEFSMLAAIAVPLTIHFARYAEKKRVRQLAVVGCGIALLAMPAGVSRTGVGALAAAFLVYMWTFKLRGLGYAALAMAGALLAEFLAAPNTTQALWNTIAHSAEDASVLDRVAGIATVAKTFRAHPLFGLGFGGAPPDEYGFLDNQWLQMIVQGGSFGLLAMIVVTAGGIFGMSAALRGATNARERDQAWALSAMFAGVVVSSFTFDLFGFQQATSLFFILFGLLWSSYKVPIQEPASGRADDGTSFGLPVARRDL